MGEHTKEPWEFKKLTAKGFIEIVSQTGPLVELGIMLRHDAKRIVVCVNFCAGFTNEELEGLDALRQLQFLGKQPNWKPFNQEDESTHPTFKGECLLEYQSERHMIDYWNFANKCWLKSSVSTVTKYMPIPKG